MLYARVWLVLLVLLSACGSAPQPPAEPKPPSEPQFGSSGDDTAVGVALAGGGDIYVVGNSERFDTWPIDDRVFLRRYTREGKLQWELLMEPEAGTEGYVFYPDALAVAADGEGNAYVAWAAAYQWHPTRPDFERVYLTKVSRGGERLWQRLTDPVTGLAVDGAGNVFVTAGGEGHLIKMTPSGGVVWELSGFSVPTGVTVTSAGDVAIIREDGIVAKYTGGGEPLWHKQVFDGAESRGAYVGKIAAGANGSLYVAGKHVYYATSRPSCEGATRYEERAYLRLYHLSPVGAARWVQDVTDNHWVEDGCLESFGWDPAAALSVAGDAAGNVYVASGVARATNNPFRPTLTDALLVKYTPAGERAWQRAFGSDQDDYATGVAARGEGEVYVVGVTAGDEGGYRDAFVRRVDGTGNQVWRR
jgi:hypothetical protein